MLTEERKRRILAEVDEKRSVSVYDLMEILGVSESTVRRDIVTLSREGRLTKVHGGAVALENPPTPEDLSIMAKESINKDEKLRIAEYAASLVAPGDYVYIDSGTTTEYMVGFLTEKRAIYVTNAISHAKNLVRRHFKVFLVGGELKENTDTLVGADAILHIQKYHFNKGFFGTNGVNLKLGYTTPDVREALIKRVAIENTQSGGKYILADHGKFGLSSSVTFSEFGGTKIITNKYPGDAYSHTADIKVV